MFKIGLVVWALTCATLTVQAQITVASGGDYIRKTFEKGRTAAISKVRSAKSCSFQSGVAPSVQQWILENQYALAVDIQLTTHNWIVDPQATCAYTTHASQSPLFLSYPTCINTTSTVEKSAFVLIHESAHHLGVHDEMQADAIAQAVLSTNDLSVCPDSISIFDPGICSGPEATPNEIGSLFSPGATTALAGNYGVYTRSRLCSMISGCGPWQKNDIMTGNRYDVPYWPQFPSVEANQAFVLSGQTQLELTTQAKAPYYQANFCKKAGNTFSCKTLPDIHTGKTYVELMTNTYNDILFVKNLNSGTPLKVENAANWNGSMMKLTNGRVASHCSWFNNVATSTLGGGLTQETETVVYGTH